MIVTLILQAYPPDKKTKELLKKLNLLKKLGYKRKMHLLGTLTRTTSPRSSTSSRVIAPFRYLKTLHQGTTPAVK
jgi:hypothetical protein